jgi:hypothetical protein
MRFRADGTRKTTLAPWVAMRSIPLKLNGRMRICGSLLESSGVSTWHWMPRWCGALRQLTKPAWRVAFAAKRRDVHSVADAQSENR